MDPSQNMKDTRYPRDPRITHSTSINSRYNPQHGTFDMTPFKHLLYKFPPPLVSTKDNKDDDTSHLPRLSQNDIQNSKDSKDTQDCAKGIQSLPQETLLRIATYLSQADKYRLAQTCRGFSISMMTPLDEQDDKEDHHALWWACVHNNGNLLKRVLARNSTLVNYRFKERHSTRSSTASVAWSEHLTPLVVAIRFGADEALLVLLRSGVDVNLADDLPLFNGTEFMGHRRRWLPINWAVHLMKAGIDFDLCIGLLVAYGANVNEAPLMLPWESPEDDPYPGDQMPLFEQLDLSIPVTRLTHIPSDEYKENYEKRRSRLISLLEVGADAKAIEPYTSHTTLYRLAQNMVNYQPPENPITDNFVNDFYGNVFIPHCLQVFEILIHYGAQLSQTSWNYYNGLCNPLHLMCGRSGRYEDVINYLLEKGMNINEADSYGRTPVYEMLACPPSDLKVLSRFIAKGVNLHHRDNMLRTPLHAVCAGYCSSQERLRQIVKILLHHGANAAATDIDEKTPLTLFLSTRRLAFQEDLIKLLRSAERRASTHADNSDKAGRGGHGGVGGRGGRGGKCVKGS
ncbi:ankyrin [Annulohypoxylon moriforme]|nr:ankyrin [Annulohypoxylon moriforme]